MALAWRVRRGVSWGAPPAVSLALALGCAGCGDLFHSTSWNTSCAGEDPAPECNATGGPGTGGSGGAGNSGGSSVGAGGEVPTAVPCSGRFGDATDQHLASLAIDAEGAALVVGRFSGSVMFGDEELVSAGGMDAFVAKLDTECNVIYAASFGAAQDDEAVANAVDSEGNHYVVGSFLGTVDFGDEPVAAESIRDGFLLKLDASGGFVWKEVITSNTVALRMRALAADDDAVVAAGDYDSGIAGDTDLFVVEFDPQGTDRWVKTFGGAGIDEPMAVALDDAGHVWVSGNFDASIDFGGGALTSAGGVDAFVVQLDEAGEHVLSTRFGGALSQNGNNLAAIPGGGVVLASAFEGTIELGTAALASAGGTDAYVARLDEGGKLVWAYAYGGAADDHARSVAVDGLGEIVVSGEFAASAAFGAEPLVSAGEQDAFVLILKASGEHVASLGFGDAGSQTAFGATRDAMGQLIVAGDFAGGIDFGEGMLESAGGGDMFIARTAVE